MRSDNRDSVWLISKQGHLWPQQNTAVSTVTLQFHAEWQRGVIDSLPLSGAHSQLLSRSSRLQTANPNEGEFLCGQSFKKSPQSCEGRRKEGLRRIQPHRAGCLSEELSAGTSGPGSASLK